MGGRRWWRVGERGLRLWLACAWLIMPYIVDTEGDCFPLATDGDGKSDFVSKPLVCLPPSKGDERKGFASDMIPRVRPRNNPHRDAPGSSPVQSTVSKTTKIVAHDTAKPSPIVIITPPEARTHAEHRICILSKRLAELYIQD